MSGGGPLMSLVASDPLPCLFMTIPSRSFLHVYLLAALISAVAAADSFLPDRAREREEEGERD